MNSVIVELIKPFTSLKLIELNVKLLLFDISLFWNIPNDFIGQ